MNLIFYLSLLKIVILFIIPLINSNKTTKILICQQNRIIIKHESSKLINATSKSNWLSKFTSNCWGKKTNNNNNIQAQMDKSILNKSISELIQLGIQETIKISYHKIVKDKYIFLEKDSLFKNILISTNDYNFQAFAPNNFLNLRHLYNISEDFNASFNTSLLIKNLQFNNFNDNYYYTKDKKFSVNIITEQKFMFITSLLSRYFSHICKYQLSLLPRIAGLYYLKTEKFKYYIMVTSYILHHALPHSENQLYYINGTTRSSLTINNTDKPSFCYLEKDFNLNYPNGLQISADVYNDLKNVMVKDIIFLRNLNISNYIFVLLITLSHKSHKNSKVKFSVVNEFNGKLIPSQNEQKNSIIATVGDLNLMLNISIDNVFQNINDQNEYIFTCHHRCSIKYLTNQNIVNYGFNFYRVITRKVLKSDVNRTTVS